MDRNSNLIYFNNNRTTPMDEEVIEIMNAASTENTAVCEEKAKTQLSLLLNCNPAEILFTKGTSESVRLVLTSAFRFFKDKGNHIITNITEHPAVLECCEELKKLGAEITYLTVDKEGLIDPMELRSAIKSQTIMVSIMSANNETGVIQPFEKIAEICEDNNLFFFSDASQYAGKLRCDMEDTGPAALAFSAHKMYGPEGIGVLYIHKKQEDLMHHIKTNYSENFTSAQLLGFAKAAEISRETYWENSARISKLKNYFEHQILDIAGLRINGSTRYRLYNTSNISFSNPEKIIPLLKKFDFADNLNKPSYVLKAMGLNDEEIKNSFRFSFGKQNTLEEVKLLVEEIVTANKP